MFDVQGKRLPYGAIKAFCAEHKLSRPTVIRMVRLGRAVLNPAGVELVVVPGPAQLRGTTTQGASFKQPPVTTLAIDPSPTWEGRCAAFGTLSERMIADRPDGKSAEDAAGDLNCQVRLALGAVMRGVVP